MLEISSAVQISSFILFILLFVVLYFFLLKNKWIFKWKRNLMILLTLISVAVLGTLLANRYGTIDLVMIIGVITASPIMAYSLSMIKVYLDKNKNKRIIETKNRKEKNDKNKYKNKSKSK